MPRSPLEALIDQATGYDPSAHLLDLVTLECERCGATIRVAREPDFFDLDRITTVCPACSLPTPEAR